MAGPMVLQMHGALGGGLEGEGYVPLPADYQGNHTLQDYLTLFDVPCGPTPHELQQTQIALDYECLRHASNRESASSPGDGLDVDSLVQLAVKLSEPISQCRHPGTPLLQTIQLRTLISCFALLHYRGVHTLDTTLWDKLKSRNILAHFEKIAFQPNSPSSFPLETVIRYAPNTYLIQLAAQYISFWRRGDSPWTSIVTPSFDILFAALTMASGQNCSFQQILSSLDQIVSIWQRPQTRYSALFMLQEYVRRISSAFRYVTEQTHSFDLANIIAFFVAALLGKVDEIFATEFEVMPTRLANYWHKTLAAFHRGPPALDRGYYFYGLLDCTAQIAAISEPTMLPSRLVGRLDELIVHSEVVEFRWKAMEIILACPNTRDAQYSRLEADMSNIAPTVAKMRMQHATIIQDHLTGDERSGWKLTGFEPLKPAAALEAEPGLRPTTVSSEADLEVMWRERQVSRSKIKGTPLALTFPFPRSRFGPSFRSAGLSSDCKHVFLHSDKEICVVNIESLAVPYVCPLSPKVKGDAIHSAALSERFLVTLTRKNMTIFHIATAIEIDAVPHGNWIPSGLVIREKGVYLVIALGLYQAHPANRYEGQIKLLKYTIGRGLEASSSTLVLPLPDSDCPGRICLGAELTMLSCTTRLQNKILVWKLQANLDVAEELFDFVKNRYTPETRDTGITSLSTYTPSDRTYLLTTTSPSTERWRNQGEWSFTLPLPHDETEPEPPPRIVHDFEQFRDHRALVAGCVSETHNAFAVLEETGRISYVHLDAHPQGGVSGKDADATILPVMLSRQERPSASCVRFDPEGRRLFAVDPKGKLILVEFERV